jgi:hypothetical protein
MSLYGKGKGKGNVGYGDYSGNGGGKGSSGLGQYGRNLNAFGKFSCEHFTSFGSLTTKCTLCNVSVGSNSNKGDNNYSANNYSSNSRYSNGSNFSSYNRGYNRNGSGAYGGGGKGKGGRQDDGGESRLKDVTDHTMDFIFPQSCLDNDAFSKLSSNVDLLDLVKRTCKVRMNAAAKAVENSWNRRDNQYGLDLRNNKVNQSAIYCFDAVTASSKNSGCHDEYIHWKKWFMDTRDNGLAENPRDGTRFFETFSDFIQSDFSRHYWHNTGRRNAVHKFADSKWNVLGDAVINDRAMTLGVNAGSSTVKLCDYLNGAKDLDGPSLIPGIPSHADAGVTSGEGKSTVTDLVDTSPSPGKSSSGPEKISPAPRQSSSGLGLNLNGTTIDLSQLVQLIKKELAAPVVETEGSDPATSVLDSVRKKLKLMTPTRQIQQSVIMDSTATNSYFEQLNSEQNSSNSDSTTKDSSAETSAKNELKRLLNTYLSSNEHFYDVASDEGKRKRDDDDVDLTLALFKAMDECDNFTTSVCKTTCTITGITYATTKHAIPADSTAKRMSCLSKTCMLIAIMAWKFYKTDKLVIPTFELSAPSTAK